MARTPHLVFTGGGTLGHVMPNVPLIRHYQEQGYTISYIGSKNGAERAFIENLGICYYPIRTGKLRRYFDWQNFLDIFNVSIGILQCFWLLLRLRPAALFSKGGYVALPPVVAAGTLRIPVVIHESDRTPGLTTRLSKRFARCICVAFQNATAYFDPKKVHWTGLPVRDKVFTAEQATGLTFLGYEGVRPVLLVFGGSLGAAFLNDFIRAQVRAGHLDGYDVVNICGKGKLDPSMNTSNYRQYEQLGAEFLPIMKAADVVITRGGATSLFELLAMQTPPIIVPLSKQSSRGDQIHNAAYFTELGVAYTLEEEEVSWPAMKALLERVQVERPALIERIQQLEFDQATLKVVAVIDSVL